MLDDLYVVYLKCNVLSLNLILNTLIVLYMYVFLFSLNEFNYQPLKQLLNQNDQLEI